MCIRDSKRDEQFSQYEILCSLDLVFCYLRNLNMVSRIFGQGIFEIMHFNRARMKPIFDSQVYENLEIFKLKN